MTAPVRLDGRPDPVPSPGAEATEGDYDALVEELRERIGALAERAVPV